MRRKQLLSTFIAMVACSMSLAAQTTVTTAGGTTSTVPIFTGSSTIGNSPITVSGSNVGIGTTSPSAPLHVSAVNGGYGSILATVPPGLYANGASVGQGYGLVSTSSFQNQQAWANMGLIQTTANANDISAGTYLSIHGWYANSSTSLPIALGGGYAGLTPSIYIAAGNGTGGGSVGIGTTNPGAKLEIDGNVKLTSGSGASVTYADGTTQSTAWTGVLCGGDYAEAVKTSGAKKLYEAGDVLVLSSSTTGSVEKSRQPYSTMVAGIYATKPGVIGRRQSLGKSGDDVPMAMVGIVPTKVTAENGPVHQGDLLVTSSMPGFAMKGTDRNRMLGAVIGKAMGSLDSGSGVIEVLVTLQ